MLLCQICHMHGARGKEAVCVARALATCGCDVNTVPSAMHLGPAASDLERHLGASGS